MSLLRTNLTTSLLRQTQRPSPTTLPRFISSSSRLFAQEPPPGNTDFPSAKSAGKKNHPADDQQSSASSKDPDEQKSGDDHPAKQPDTQAPSERSTGFNEVPGGVKGGKEGLGQRTDK